MATRGWPEHLGQLGIVRRQDVDHFMIEADQTADPVTGIGDADHVVGTAVEHVTLARHPLVEGQDAPRRDVLPEDPTHGELQVPLDPPGLRREHPVEAGGPQGVAGHRGRSEIAPGWVLTTSRPLAARAMASWNAAILVRV